jgi:hypothetical protein
MACTCHPKLCEISRAAVQGQPGKKVYKTPSQWEKAGHGGMVARWHTPVTLVMVRSLKQEGVLGKSEALSPK